MRLGTSLKTTVRLRMNTTGRLIWLPKGRAVSASLRVVARWYRFFADIGIPWVPQVEAVESVERANLLNQLEEAESTIPDVGVYVPAVGRTVPCF